MAQEPELYFGSELRDLLDGAEDVFRGDRSWSSECRNGGCTDFPFLVDDGQDLVVGDLVGEIVLNEFVHLVEESREEAHRIFCSISNIINLISTQYYKAKRTMITFINLF